MSIADTVVGTVQTQLNQKDRVVVAISGPQGSGKTTVSRKAAEILNKDHHTPTLAVSLDDFYKPYTELQKVALRGNPLLQHRGLPGTHDYGLLLNFLREFKAGKDDLQVPTYDKSAYNGAGDRSKFVNVPSDTKAILIEGWMIGFKPIGDQNIVDQAEAIAQQPWSVKPSSADLLEIEHSLSKYVAIWDEFDEFVRLIPANLNFIYDWRLQQEHELKAAHGRGMTDEQVKEFVDQYMPCYFLYNKTLPKGISFELDSDHHASKL